MLLTTLLMTTDGDPRPELRLFLKSVPGLELVDGPHGIPTLADMQAPDLVILDASAPGSDGEPLLRALRSRLPDARFLVLIGSPGRSAPVLADAADYILLTGFSTAEFFEALNALSLP